HQVVVTHGGRIGGVAHLEPGPLANTCRRGLLVGRGDRRLVEVEAVDLGVRIGAGDGDRRRSAMPAPAATSPAVIAPAPASVSYRPRRTPSSTLASSI